MGTAASPPRAPQVHALSLWGAALGGGAPPPTLAAPPLQGGLALPAGRGDEEGHRQGGVGSESCSLEPPRPDAGTRPPAVGCAARPAGRRGTGAPVTTGSRSVLRAGPGAPGVVAQKPLGSLVRPALRSCPLHTSPLPTSQVGPPTCPPEGLGRLLGVPRVPPATEEGGEPKRPSSFHLVSFRVLGGRAFSQTPTRGPPSPRGGACMFKLFCVRWKTGRGLPTPPTPLLPPALLFPSARRGCEPPSNVVPAPRPGSLWPPAGPPRLPWPVESSRSPGPSTPSGSLSAAALAARACVFCPQRAGSARTRVSQDRRPPRWPRHPPHRLQVGAGGFLNSIRCVT